MLSLRLIHYFCRVAVLVGVSSAFVGAQVTGTILGTVVDESGAAIVGAPVSVSNDLTGEVLPDWARLAVSGATIAVYMGRTVAASVARRLMQAGLPAETTVAVIENASRADRRLLHGILKDLPDLEDRTELSGPVMVIIGDAVAGANFARSEPLVVGSKRRTDNAIDVAAARSEPVLN